MTLTGVCILCSLRFFGVAFLTEKDKKNNKKERKKKKKRKKRKKKKKKGGGGGGERRPIAIEINIFFYVYCQCQVLIGKESCVFIKHFNLLCLL